MINPELIRTFLTLAETKHFTRTAEKLHMTQPGVSQHLKRLEQHFDVPLIHRQGKSFSLTESGKRLVQYGSELLEGHKKFREVIREDDPYRGRCLLSSPGSYAYKVFDVMLEMTRKHRDLKPEVMVAPNSAVVGYLRSERVDVGFMSEPVRDPAVDSELFATERLMLAVPRGTRDLSWKGLQKLGFINHPDGFYYANRLLAKNYSEFQGMERFPISAFINQINRILDPVAEGLGFAVLPDTACERYPRRKDVTFSFLKKGVEEPIYKVTRRGEKLPERYGRILKALLA